MTTTKHRLHEAISKMLTVDEVGFGLTPHKRSYDVRINTKGHNITLISYEGGKVAYAAREHLIDEITNRIHELIGEPEPDDLKIIAKELAQALENCIYAHDFCLEHKGDGTNLSMDLSLITRVANSSKETIQRYREWRDETGN